MANLLFGASIYGWGFDKFPSGFPLVDPYWISLSKKAIDPSSCFSKYSPYGAKGPVSAHSGVIAAAMMLAEPYACVGGFRPGSGVVRVTDNQYVSEYHHSDGRVTFVFYNRDRGIFKAAIQTGEGGPGTVYVPLPALSEKDKTNLLPFYMVLAAAECDRNVEYATDINVLKRDLAANPCSSDCIRALYRISDTMYFGIKDKHIPNEIPRDGNLPKLDSSALWGGAYSGQVVCGNPELLLKYSGQVAGMSTNPKKTPDKTIGETRALPEIQKYIAEKCSNWTDEEKKLIPVFPEGKVVPEEVVQCAQAIVLTANCTRPIVQLGWRGTSAYGKSTGVEMLACILNKPLLKFTCSSTTEKQDFLTQIMPDTSKRTEMTAISFDDIACDPEGVYERLTGKYVCGISCDEVMQEAVRQMAAGVSTTPRYVMQESAYIRALKHGYMVEVQESSRIRDAGVLPGLNEYDRPGALIPQVDGSYARRHEDAIVFFTDNVGYRSCNELDPSVIRRIAFFIDSTDLPKQKALNRIFENTNDPALISISANQTLVSNMYDMWEGIKRYCEDNDLLAAGGCVTIEELERWIQMTAIWGIENIRRACIYCVVNKATSDYEEQKNIIANVVDLKMSTLV